MTIDITTNAAQALLEEIVREFPPGYAFEDQLVANGLPSSGACRYRTADRSQPLCLVGVFLDHLGVEIDPRFDYGGGTSAGGLLNALSVEGVITYEDDARALLTHVQSAQDGGMAWDEALERGVRRARYDYDYYFTR